MATLYDRCRPREWMNGRYPYFFWLVPRAHWPVQGTHINIPADDYREHWLLEGPRAPEEVK